MCIIRNKWPKLGQIFETKGNVQFYIESARDKYALGVNLIELYLKLHKKSF